MNLKDIQLNLKKLNVSYALGEPCQDKCLTDCENALRLKLPRQIKLFYKSMNGLIVEKPALAIRALDELEIDNKGLMHFAVFDNKHIIAFDTNSINNAEQWNIVNRDTGYLVTLTMASFWANKIWAWLISQRTIWKEEFYPGN